MSRLAIAFLIALGAAACTPQQRYASGQNYQRQQCERLPDMGERQRCLEKANMSYEEYRKESQAAGN